MAIDFVFLVGIRLRKLCNLTVKAGIQTSCDVKVKCNSAVCNIWTIEILVLVFKLKQMLSVFHTPMLYNKFKLIVRRKLLNNGMEMKLSILMILYLTQGYSASGKTSHFYWRKTNYVIPWLKG